MRTRAGGENENWDTNFLFWNFLVVDKCSVEGITHKGGSGAKEVRGHLT